MHHSAEELRLLELLKNHGEWPCLFPFKFIVPSKEGHSLEAMFADAIKKELRPSSNGKYLAFTFHYWVESPGKVLENYAKASGVPGIISL